MNVHIFLSPFKHESRVLKELYTLEQEGIFENILVIALWEHGLKQRETISDISSVWRVSLKSQPLPKLFNILKYLEWLVQIIWMLRIYKKIQVVQAHSLSALPIAVLVKWLWSARIVYDAHELETETNGLQGIKKIIAKVTEFFCIIFVDSVLVVSPSIFQWYQKKYPNKSIFLVRNVPNYNPNIIDNFQIESVSLLKQTYKLQNSDVLFIYQGGLFPGRGIEKILKIFTKVQSDKHIIFMGYGSLSQLVKDYEKKHKNIHFLSAVTPEKVLKYTASADIGICFIENTCLSYYYSLPNKLFEYLTAGLPVIINELPDQKHIVEKYNCGWVLNENEDETLIQLVNGINQEILMQKKLFAKKAITNIGWHFETKQFLEAYHKLL